MLTVFINKDSTCYLSFLPPTALNTLICLTCSLSFPSSPGVLKPTSPFLLCQTVLIKTLGVSVVFPASLKPFVLFSCCSVSDHDKVYVKALQMLNVFKLLDTGDTTLKD